MPEPELNYALISDVEHLMFLFYSSMCLLAATEPDLLEQKIIEQSWSCRWAEYLASRMYS